jgi:hypothetical protein
MPLTTMVSALPRLSLNGFATHYTHGLVIDHLARRVRGAVVIEPGDPLVDLLRSLRNGDKVKLEFVSCGPQKTDDSDDTIEYSGDAEAIMIRVRPRRGNVLAVLFAFKLLQ